MARELDQDELVEHWALLRDDLDRVAGNRGAAKLGFALLLKFFAARGRFPRGRSELPPVAVEFVGPSSCRFRLLIWAHVVMHGEFKLNMNSRLDLGHTRPQADPPIPLWTG